MFEIIIPKYVSKRLLRERKWFGIEKKLKCKPDSVGKILVGLKGLLRETKIGKYRVYFIIINVDGKNGCVFRSRIQA